MLLFLDESGDHGLANIDPQFPVFVLCGILISELEYERLDKKIKALKTDFWNTDHVIFHSRDIRKCEKEFVTLHNLEIKNKFYKGLNKIITECNYEVVSALIDKNKYLEQYGKLSNVYEISLSFIIEHCAIRVLNQTLEIYIESRGKKEDKELDNYFRLLHKNGTYKLEPRALQAVVKDIKFCSKKENISGLQLSDLAAYPIATHWMDQKRPNPAYNLIASKISRVGEATSGIKKFP